MFAAGSCVCATRFDGATPSTTSKQTFTFQRAQSAIESQDYAEARLELEKILELQPQHDSNSPQRSSPSPMWSRLRVQGASEDALRKRSTALGGDQVKTAIATWRH